MTFQLLSYLFRQLKSIFSLVFRKEGLSEDLSYCLILFGNQKEKLSKASWSKVPTSQFTTRPKFPKLQLFEWFKLI